MLAGYRVAVTRLLRDPALSIEATLDALREQAEAEEAEEAQRAGIASCNL